MNRKHTTIIEITDTHVKWVRYLKSGMTAVICDSGLEKLEKQTDEEIEQIFKTSTSFKKIKQDSLYLILPRKYVMLRNVRLPTENEQEIRQMLDLQLPGQLPYALDEIVYDYTFSGMPEPGYSNLWVYIVHKDISLRYFKMFSQAGLKPDHFTVSPVCLFEWYLRNIRPADPESLNTVVMINLDVNVTELGFMNSKNVLFSRVINYGAHDLYSDDFYALFEQIEMSVNAYLKDNLGPAIKKIIIVSALKETLTLKEKIEQELLIKTEIVSPLDSEQITTQPKMTAWRNNFDVSFVNLLGLISAKVEYTPNFIPQEIFEKNRGISRRFELVKTAVICISIIILIVSYYGFNVFKKTRELNKIETIDAVLTKQVKEARQRLELVDRMESNINDQVLVSDLFLELYNLTPKDITLRSLNIDKDGKLTIQGYAVQGTDLNQFQSNLVQSKFLSEVNLNFATKMTIYTKQVTDFKISSKLKLHYEDNIN